MAVGVGCRDSCAESQTRMRDFRLPPEQSSREVWVQLDQALV